MKKTKILFYFSVILWLVMPLGFAKAGEIKNPEVKKGYNIILIIIDDLRSDHLGCYGYRKKTSPNIDALAKKSFVFENSFSHAAFTLPSTISILTSTYPESHDMYFVFKDKLSLRIPTMAEVLSLYDYKTAWFSLLREPHLDVNVGFGRGFQYQKEYDGSLHAFRDIASWIEKNKTHMFFLAIDSRSVHDYPKFFNLSDSESDDKLATDIRSINKPYYYKLVEIAKSKRPPFDNPAFLRNNPELFNGVYELRKVKQIEEMLSPENKFKINLIRNSLVVAFVRNFGSKYPKSWIKTYDSAIQNTDDKLIKPLLDKIKSSQLEDNTIIIITADHGEAFGEHGIYGHGWNMFDEFIRVPLIIKVPRIEKGRKIRALVQGVDIMPTALELAGVVCPHQAQGKSLVNLMSKVNAAPVHEYIFSGGKKVEKTIRSLEWKLITGCTVASKKELYNLRLDPGEKNNIYDKNKDVALKLELKFKEWEASLPFYKDQEYSFSSEIDKATQEKIRKTGYW